MADLAAGALTNVPAVDFYTVSPCRVFDTRVVSGPTGGAPLTVRHRRTNFTMVGGTCGVPSGAKAVSAQRDGDGSPPPRATCGSTPRALRRRSPPTLNYVAGLTRANNAVAPLSAAGQLSVKCAPSGTAHVIVDVNGYFQ